MTPERERFFRALAQRMAELGPDPSSFFMETGRGQNVATSLCFDYGSNRDCCTIVDMIPELSYFSVGLLLHAMCVQGRHRPGHRLF